MNRYDPSDELKRRIDRFLNVFYFLILVGCGSVAAYWFLVKLSESGWR